MFLKIPLKSLIKNKFKILKRFFKKTSVLNCFQNLFKWFNSRFWKCSVPNIWEDWLESILVLNSDQDLELNSVLNSDQKSDPNCDQKFLKRFWSKSWIDFLSSSSQNWVYFCSFFNYNPKWKILYEVFIKLIKTRKKSSFFKHLKSTFLILE